MADIGFHPPPAGLPKYWAKTIPHRQAPLPPLNQPLALFSALATEPKLFNQPQSGCKDSGEDQQAKHAEFCSKDDGCLVLRFVGDSLTQTHLLCTLPKPASKHLRLLHLI